MAQTSRLVDFVALKDGWSTFGADCIKAYYKSKRLEKVCVKPPAEYLELRRLAGLPTDIAWKLHRMLHRKPHIKLHRKLILDRAALKRLPRDLPGATSCLRRLSGRGWARIGRGAHGAPGRSHGAALPKGGPADARSGAGWGCCRPGGGRTFSANS